MNKVHSAIIRKGNKKKHKRERVNRFQQLSTEEKMVQLEKLLKIR